MNDTNKVFIVAELSSNHNQSFEIAQQTIEAMKESGADAVKFQTYTPDTMTLNSRRKQFRLHPNSLWDYETMYQLYKKAQTPWEWHIPLKQFAESIGLVWFSTPFDKTSVDFLETINTPMYKIASFEITDIPLIKYVASKGKPIMISTGVATFSEIVEAIEACHNVHDNEITLLKCTSVYPTPLNDVNLLTMDDFKTSFETPIESRHFLKIGISDHTLNSTVSIASVALGASVIEKHFTLSRKLSTPDAAFSLEPHEFKEMVNAVRETEQVLGHVTYNIPTSAMKNLQFKRSLFVVKDIKAGEKYTDDNIKSLRPHNGMHPRYLENTIGKTASCNIKKGIPLSKNLIN